MKLQEVKSIEEIEERILRIYNDHKFEIKASLERIKEIGLLLIEAKEILGYGEFGRWRDRVMPFQRWHCAHYMRIAAEWDKVVEAPPPAPGLKMNLTRAMETLGMAAPHTQRRRYVGYGKKLNDESSNEEVIATIVNLLMRRDDPDDILERVRLKLKQLKVLL